ncbi:MAG: hypothetical protein BAJALOKI3v1_120047 [Promethearchaeota archaeon]|jgi:hypothetical protein|nr:MAG: hypothetical protein BAJALOKI3v1_120047 [Candidatus Lokiarchaeota archaeon]
MDIEHRYKMIFLSLPDKISKIVGDLDTIKVERLNSKKNLVFDLSVEDSSDTLQKDYILKYYRTKNADIEFTTLSHLYKQGLDVPSVISYEKPFLLLEKIDGINLCDFINEPLHKISEISELESEMRKKIIKSIDMLASWLTDLHKRNIITHKDLEKTIVLNKGDTRLRDFIIQMDNKMVYGLDFEEAYEGNHIDDLAWICCSLIDTKPGLFELDEPYHKIELMNEFLKHYYKINNDFTFSFSYFAEALINNLNIVIKRRGLNVGKLDKKRILNNITSNF